MGHLAHNIILANGEFPQDRQCLDALQNAEHLVCCDGATVALIASGLREPDAIVGDLDSIPEALKRRFADRLHPEAEQETNDLAKAFRFCQSQGWIDHLVILGAMGRRDDHAIGNLALLLDFAQTAPDAQLWTDYGFFQVLASSTTLPSTPGEQISIFSPDATQPITTKGLRYPLAAQPLEKLWSGTLNECDGTSFRLEFPCTSPLLLYRPWPRVAGKQPPATAPRLPWRKVHFIGVGGVGVSGLAQILLDAGVVVSGSDAQDSTYARRLREQGAQIFIGHCAENLSDDADLVVYSAAIQADNPERQAAQHVGIPQCRRGQFLARLAPYFRRVVAVAGSHGKTTTTAMLAHILREYGVNPGFLVGGLVTDWERSAAAGSWNILVTEVDESDRSQELMLPTLSVILNIDDDHSWGIGGTAGLEECFARLASQSLRTLTWNTPDLRRILQGAPNLTALPLTASEDTTLATLPLCGIHNRQNAAIAVAAAQMLGVPREEAINALRSFPGVQRRLTIRWQSEDRQCAFVDDYAHHPTELTASLQAIREQFPTQRLVVYFQPHRPERILRYGKRFAETLSAYADHVVLVRPFLAWEDEDADANPQVIVDAINRIAPGQAELTTTDWEPLAYEIGQMLQHSPTPLVVAAIGAGDIGNIGAWFEKHK